ncbi:MAG: hypothetical protein U0031_18570 [Thermomicrobiales bacterium]
MDGPQFDRLTQQLGQALTRRRFGVLAAALGLGAGLGATNPAKAKPKKKKPKPCGRGAIRCGRKCVNPLTDAANCGKCGRACAAGQACVSGSCQAGGCPGTQISCGGTCVDPQSDEDHCGDCTTVCNGDLTCIDGHCACATGTKCGNQCVNTQTDNAHCGDCGTSCGNGKTCQGGQCVAVPECSSQAECGGSSSNDLVCRNGRCVCADATKGICTRFPDGRGTCHVCCPGGSGQCPGNRNEVCFYYQTPSGAWAGLCDCATGADRCESNDRTCVADYMTDPRHCGRFCKDCQFLPEEAGAVCCNGNCTRGCAPGFSGSGCMQSDPCGANCEPCSSGMICCNQGPGTAASCIPNNHGGFCYKQ